YGGPETDVHGEGKGLYILNNIADCFYLKQFCAIWNNNVAVWIRGNWIRSVGMASDFADDAGCYGILVYQNGSETGSGPSRYVNILHNTITSPRSAGVYATHAKNLKIAKNFISGQTDQVDAT